MTRPYNRHEPEPIVLTDAVEPEKITYHYGSQLVTLTGTLAWLYRGMIRMYGEDEAKERFWFLFHKKSSVTTPDNAAITLG